MVFLVFLLFGSGIRCCNCGISTAIVQVLRWEFYMVCNRLRHTGLHRTTTDPKLILSNLTKLISDQLLSCAGRHDACSCIPFEISGVYLYYSRLIPAVTTSDPRQLLLRLISQEPIYLI